MRRAMLTNRPTAGPPFTVGDAATVRASTISNDLVINLDNPAPHAGTVTSASCCLAGVNPSDLRFFTGTWDGATFTVTAATGNLGGLSGSNTFTVSLSIPSGGYLGVYHTGSSLYLDSTGGSALRLATASPPTAGLTYAPSSMAWVVSIQGTGA